jgi:hypothetical protein
MKVSEKMKRILVKFGILEWRKVVERFRVV